MAMIAVAVLGGACGMPDHQGDSSAKYSVKTDLVTFKIDLNFNVEDGMAYATDEAIFQNFLKDYHRRGRTVLVVSTTPLTRIKQEQSILSRLRSEGISQGSIAIKRGEALGTNTLGASLSFKGYIISVPKCGNWTDQSSFNPNNLEPANFGCAYRRNIGLMLSDPGDLVTSKGVIEVDARRMDTVLGIYRSGKSAGAEKPQLEAGKFAVSKQK
jgi:pilus assembly protein CpaD